MKKMFWRKRPWIIISAATIFLLAVVTVTYKYSLSGMIILNVQEAGKEENKALQEEQKDASEASDPAPDGRDEIKETTPAIDVDLKENPGENVSQRSLMAMRSTLSVSRGEEMNSKITPIPWFGDAERIFQTGMDATVTDIDTGLSVQVQRTYGTNHADVEALTYKDSEILKNIAGGEWSWSRRAVVVDINGRKLAASINMMPHAGKDAEPANKGVKNRSGGFGTGKNLDSVKGNGMDGHICIHFLHSRTHGSDQEDQQHQQMVVKAYRWLLANGAG